ncbi:MAG TPA: biopolymer transporter ExbD [Stellaceae bacterium]|jgi:biopolymer transport protein ExbD|nr:biopolymer transporter ExbD [Stellaceae bacterium]
MAVVVDPREDDEDALTAAINTTPLVDVMLVLLIIFLITVPVVVHSVPVALPRESDQPNIAQPQTIVLAIAKDGTAYWNDARLADDDDLQARLGARASGAPLPEVQIRADQDVAYEFVARVVADCRRAGIAKLAFVIEPDRTGASAAE